MANGGSQTRFNASSGAGIVNAGVDTLIFTPDKFTRNGRSPSNSPDNFTSSGDQNSYVDDLIDMVERFEAFSGAPMPKVYIYDSWPKPPSQNAAGLAQLKQDSFNYFRSWAHQFQADVSAKRPDLQVKLIHSAEIFADVMDNTPASALGYFDWFRDDAPHGNPSAYVIAGAIMFRHSLLLAGGAEPTEGQVEMMMTSAIDTCESYFQAFQTVVWSGANARDALDHAMFETLGEA